MIKKVKLFLNKYGMDYESISIEKQCKAFIDEMEKGLSGLQGSLPMIPAYINVIQDIPLEEQVIVIDAGGTNLRVAIVLFNKEKKPVIEDYCTYPMPGTDKEITKEEFFSTIAKHISPLCEKSNKIGLCFSYTFETLPNKDGRVVQLSKELKVRDLEGELLGEGLTQSLKKMGTTQIKNTVIVNDTVATLLGCRASFPDRIFDGYIGFILGTGTNICYLENNKNIKKIRAISESEGTMAINVESGAYSCMPRGGIDFEFDQNTIDPGEHRFEKMVAGGYLGGLIFAVIKKAAQDGLFSDSFAENILSVENLTLKEVNDFLYYPYNKSHPLVKCCSTIRAEQENDCLILYHLIDNIIERAAKLVAINLSAVIQKTGIGKNPCRPVCITAEGTTFYKLKQFRNKLEYYLKLYLNEQKHIYYEFTKVDDVTLIGTAIAGLTNCNV